MSDYTFCPECGCALVERTDLARSSWEIYQDCSNIDCNIRIHTIYGDMTTDSTYVIRKQ
jgi:hypothetical protein